MGCTIKEMKCLDSRRPIPAPMAMAMAELIRRLRRSTKWSKKDMRAPGSSGSGVTTGISSWAGSAIASVVRVGSREFAGLRLLRFEVELLRSRRNLLLKCSGVGPRGLDGAGRRRQFGRGILWRAGGINGIARFGSGKRKRIGRQPAPYGILRFGCGCGLCSLGRGLSFARFAQFGLAFEVAHVVFESRAQVAGGAAKFAHDFAEIPSQIRKLFRAEYDQGDDKDDNGMWHGGQWGC